jgi:lysophospholipase L1-like esterase
VVNEGLRQILPIRSRDSYDQSYQLGSYVVLADAVGLADYRYRVEAEYLASGSADDVGILFRYRDAGNFYRLSFNSRYGFTRLEKRVNGRFTPLATNARGYLRGEVLDLEVEVRGSQMLVWRNGDPLFAVNDTSHPVGTVGLYAQDLARFDNVRLERPVAAPRLVLSTPLAHVTSSGTSLRATAFTSSAPDGAQIEFLLNGSPVALAAANPAPPHRVDVDLPLLTPGNYELTAILEDQSGSELARDRNQVIGVGGEYHAGIGDSITNGTADNYSRDNASALGRIVGLQGYESTLTDLLDQTTPRPNNLVFNEGIGGDDSYDAAFLRIDSIMARHPGMDTGLIMIGTNDAGQQIPAGLGCTGAACDGTYKGNLQTLIAKVQASGITPVIAYPPPGWNSTTPWTSSFNNRIRQYIDAIDEVASLDPDVLMGPDFFAFFMPSEAVNYRSLFADTLHPNALGYRMMSYLWHNALNPSEALPLPFKLDNLRLSTGKLPQQNLLETGNRYYVDEAFTLTGLIPQALAEGRWIMTPNADRDTAATNYLRFAVDRPVTLYVAYDASANTLPSWMGGFQQVVGSTLATTNPAAPTLELYRKTYPAGAITLGGNEGLISGARANYVVVVVE